MNVKRITDILGRLALLKYFPSDPAARLALVEIVCGMLHPIWDTWDGAPGEWTAERQAEWLVRRMLKLYAEWPGIGELRACYCSRFSPRDGENA